MNEHRETACIEYAKNKEDCMKATGIVRRIDDLGRIVIPKEIRRTLRIRETDPMEIYTGQNHIDENSAI